MSLTELIGIAIGCMLMALGFGSIAAWLLRHRAAEPLLLLFGIWCSRYGLRLVALQPPVHGSIGGSHRTWDYIIAFVTYVIKKVVVKRIVITPAICAAVVAALTAADVNDWPSHDHDAGGRRFSPLTQITPANVAKLQPAWTFDTGASGIQVTPLVVGGLMYVTAGRDIMALEPETAKE